MINLFKHQEKTSSSRPSEESPLQINIMMEHGKEESDKSESVVYLGSINKEPTSVRDG